MNAPSVERLIARTLAIEAESAQDAGALGFMARAMVQATLPHRKVEGSEFVRRNGAYTLRLLAPSDPGLPYGSIPRLLLAWLATEAVRTQSRELSLGTSMNAFMAQLDLSRQGGKRGDIGRLKDQTARLFATTVSATYTDADKRAEMGFRLTDKSLLWWDAKRPDQGALWRSTVKLSEPFFAEVTAHPIPVDLRALAALKRSPLALDIYCWLTYRASYLRQPVTIPWEALAAQFGSDYKLLRQFKAAFLGELRKVVTVYAAVRLDATAEGLTLKPCLTHVPKTVDK